VLYHLSYSASYSKKKSISSNIPIPSVKWE
jgi:hypothetical protein